tara:strand:- start:3106 stop:3519 length:414 start_codon:yes stop_codon:yes gene_type:complete
MTRFTLPSALQSLAMGGLAAVALAGSASADCVRLVNIHGYSVIDREHVVLNGGANRHYLVTTRQRCQDMRFGVRLETSFRNTQTICAPQFEYITPESGMRCAIDSIEEVESLEAAEALIAAREEADGTADDHTGGAE